MSQHLVDGLDELQGLLVRQHVLGELAHAPQAPHGVTHGIGSGVVRKATLESLGRQLQPIAEMLAVLAGDDGLDRGEGLAETDEVILQGGLELADVFQAGHQDTFLHVLPHLLVLDHGPQREGVLRARRLQADRRRQVEPCSLANVADAILCQDPLADRRSTLQTAVLASQLGSTKVHVAGLQTARDWRSRHGLHQSLQRKELGMNGLQLRHDSLALATQLRRSCRRASRLEPLRGCRRRPSQDVGARRLQLLAQLLKACLDGSSPGLGQALEPVDGL